jgi:hypothetical protein
MAGTRVGVRKGGAVFLFLGKRIFILKEMYLQKENVTF